MSTITTSTEKVNGTSVPVVPRLTPNQAFAENILRALGRISRLISANRDDFDVADVGATIVALKEAVLESIPGGHFNVDDDFIRGEQIVLNGREKILSRFMLDLTKEFDLRDAEEGVEPESEPEGDDEQDRDARRRNKLVVKCYAVQKVGEDGHVDAIPHFFGTEPEAKAYRDAYASFSRDNLSILKIWLVLDNLMDMLPMKEVVCSAFSATDADGEEIDI